MTENRFNPALFARFNNPVDFLSHLGKLQKDLRVVLYMPKDFYDLYEKSLSSRLKNSDIRLTIAKPDMLLEEFGSYDSILAYQCPLPDFAVTGKSVSTAEEKKPGKKGDLLEVKGAPSAKLMTPFPRKKGFQTELEHRFLNLRDIITTQEKEEHFLNLTRFQQHIRLKLLAAQQRQADVDLLVRQQQKVDAGYFLVLAFYLQQAIDNVLQLVTLGDVMRKYVKILIIDDLGDRCLDQLEELGFRKRFVSVMGHQTFNQAYEEFSQLYLEQFPDKTVDHQVFLTKCSIFDDYEIIAYNEWVLENGSMPVQFRLKKNAELSKKEVRKKEEDPAKVAHKLEKLDQESQKLTKQLKAVELELHTSEAKGGLSETAYVALNKRRKRILRNIANISETASEITKEVDDRPEMTCYTREFLSIFRDRKIVKQILGQKAARDVDPKKFKVDDMNSLVSLHASKKKKAQVLGQLNAQVKLLNKKMKGYANLHPLDPEKSSQQVLGIHSLNKMEMVILGCGIAKANSLLHRYPGPFFEARDQATPVNWNEAHIAKLSVHVASKNHVLDTSLLHHFFRVKGGDMTGRIEKSPVLPGISDFNDDKFGLFIINYNSYPFMEIIESLKLRNQSNRSYVPVLLIDSMDQMSANGKRIMLDLLLGVKSDPDGTLNLSTPPYLLESLDDQETVFPVLCDLLGVDGETIPSADDYQEALPTDLEDEAFFDQAVETQPFEEPKAPEITSGSAPSTVVKSEPAEVSENLVRRAPKREDDRIQMYLPSEKSEEVYSLGALFSFDDDAGSTKSVPEESQDPFAASLQETDDEAQISEERDPAVSDDGDEQETFEPIDQQTPVRTVTQTNPKNPFQF